MEAERHMMRPHLTPFGSSSHERLCRWFQPLCVFFIAPFALAGCSSEPFSSGPKENALVNRPPFISSARITPSQILRNSPISVLVHVNDLDGDLVTFRHHWFVNGSGIVGQTGSGLTSQLLKRGDIVMVDVVPFDGKIEGSPYRTTTVVRNTPPTVTRVLLEASLDDGVRRFRVEADGSDLDGDAIEYVFRWLHNDTQVEERDNSEVELPSVVRGDTILVEVTPSDGVMKGNSVVAGPLTIPNAAPAITSTPPQIIHDRRYVYQLHATDPDHDIITYQLQVGPSSMIIDPIRGRIEWPIPQGLSGTYHVRIVVKDSHEAESSQEFDLSLDAVS